MCSLIIYYEDESSTEPHWELSTHFTKLFTDAAIKDASLVENTLAPAFNNKTKDNVSDF